jgi:hypothetical protein
MTMKDEPVAEKTPPAASDPLTRAPVEKLTVPRECPLGAVIPLKLVSCDWVEVTPEVETEMLPNWFVRTIPSAQAAIGNAIASNARTTTRLILNPSQILSCPNFTLED